MKPNLCVSLLLVQVPTWFAGGNHAAAQTNNLPGPATQPQMLDLSRLLRERFVTPQSTNRTFQNLVGVRHYDGLPFRIEGRSWLYGRKEAQSAGKDADHYPDFTGVAVGRAFEELHLLHGCRWQEGEGQAIAIVRLNYADGTRHEWPIRYGAHVRDWQRMPSEEHESLSDTNTKVIWRTTPASTALKSTVRLFKSRFDNPFPQKTVVSLDLVSTKQLAAYDVVAATIAGHDPRRPVTLPVAPPKPDRHFSRAITVRVRDANGTPIAGALLDPGVMVDKVGVIALPQYTSTNGDGVIQYPGMRTTSLSIRVEKAGYHPQFLYWSAPKFGNESWQQALEYVALIKSFVPETSTVTLSPSNSPVTRPVSSP